MLEFDKSSCSETGSDCESNSGRSNASDSNSVDSDGSFSFYHIPENNTDSVIIENSRTGLTAKDNRNFG